MSRFEEYLEASKKDTDVLSEINAIIKRHKGWRGGSYEYRPMSPDNVQRIDELINGKSDE